MREIKSLTGLRGFAALWVCIYHYSPDKNFGALTQLAGAGHLGVPIFFVLSGFIMAYVYGEKFASGQQGYGQFLGLRMARIYPLHLVTWLAVGASIALGYRAAGPHDTASTFASGLVLLHAWGFTPAISWNEPAWSISTELFAYLLFPFFAGRLARASSLVAGLIVASAVLAFSTPALNLLPAPLNFQAGGGVLYWFLLFCAGAALYRLAETSRLDVRSHDALTLAGLALLLIPAGMGVTNWGFVAFASMLVIAGLWKDAGLSRAVFGNRVAVWLGDVSLAFYLAHLAMVHAWVYVLGHYVAGVYWFQIPLAVQVGSSLLVATVLHYAVERPARRWVRSVLRQTPSSGLKSANGITPWSPSA